jgi:DNA-binding CsgD family transcriptional regulator
VVRAAALLEAGRCDLALRVAAVPDDDVAVEHRHYLDGVRGLALLMLGGLDEADRLHRPALERAYRDFDSLGVRVHAGVLAEVLAHADERSDAWRVLEGALLIGPSGLIGRSFHRRSLRVAAVLRARAGDVELAEALTQACRRDPDGYPPVVSSLDVLARAALLEARGAGNPGALLWDAGQSFARQGLLQPALTCWLSRSARYGVDQLRTVEEAFRSRPLAALEPQMRRHASLAAGEEPAVPEPPQEPVRTPSVPRRDDQVLAPPTARELEVARLAATGMSNRAIADCLGLSVRTVENHISRCLSKLGLPDRSGLRGWPGIGPHS